MKPTCLFSGIGAKKPDKTATVADLEARHLGGLFFVYRIIIIAAMRQT